MDMCRTPDSRDSTSGGASAPVVPQATNFENYFGPHTAASGLQAWAEGSVDLLTQASTRPKKLLLSKLVQTAHTAYNLSHPADVVAGAVAKTSADYLLRSLSKARRCFSAADLVNWSGGSVRVVHEPGFSGSAAVANIEVDSPWPWEPQLSSRAQASPDAEVDVHPLPLHSKLLSSVISGCLSAAATGCHDVAVHELPGIFGAPQVRQQADIRGGWRGGKGRHTERSMQDAGQAGP